MAGLTVGSSQSSVSSSLTRGQTSCATPGLSGFTEGLARRLGPWKGLPWRRTERIMVWGHPGHLGPHLPHMVLTPSPTPTWDATRAFPGLVTHTWALSVVSAPVRFTPLRGSWPCPHPQRVRKRKNVQSQPILECCAQDCFTNRRWARSGMDYRLGLAAAGGNQRAGGHQS